MSESELRILASSRDGRELVTAAVRLARSPDAADLYALGRYVLSAEVLGRLDSEEDYEDKPSRRLRIAQLLGELAANSQPGAKDVLIELTKSRPFLERADRADLLIAASATIRPPPPAVLAFWDSHSKPSDGFTPLTMDALTENGTAPAVALLERKIADSTHSNTQKVEWMHQAILPHRNDLELLRGCQRLLASKLPEELRVALVETLFDYKPDDWYPEHLIRTPPIRQAAGAESKLQLFRLAEYSLANVSLTPELKAKVQAVLEELKPRR